MTAPTAKITLGELARVEVELGAHAYTVRPMTKALDAARRGYEEDIFLADGNDAAVKVAGEFLDALLEKPPGKRKLPSEVIAAKWAAQEVSTGQVAKLIDDLVEASEARPT